jgi:TRAP-type C4-dicarboxylate transport system permease small subunit
MTHGLDIVETDHAGVPASNPAARALAFVNNVVVKLSSVALVAAGFVLTYSVIVRYFLKISTDWQDELSVFLIVGAVFMSSAAVQAFRGHVAIEAVVGFLPPRANHISQWLVDLASLSSSARSLRGNP